jgi:hypothetical protein
MMERKHTVYTADKNGACVLNIIQKVLRCLLDLQTFFPHESGAPCTFFFPISHTLCTNGMYRQKIPLNSVRNWSEVSKRSTDLAARLTLKPRREVTSSSQLCSISGQHRDYHLGILYHHKCTCSLLYTVPVVSAQTESISVGNKDIVASNNLHKPRHHTQFH